MVSATNVVMDMMTHPLHTNHKDHLDPTLDFLAGTTAGVSGLVVGFPFDTGELNSAPTRLTCHPVQLLRLSFIFLMTGRLHHHPLPHLTKSNTGSRTRHRAFDTAPLCMRSRPSRARSASQDSTEASLHLWCVGRAHKGNRIRIPRAISEN